MAKAPKVERGVTIQVGVSSQWGGYSVYGWGGCMLDQAHPQTAWMIVKGSPYQVVACNTKDSPNTTSWSISPDGVVSVPSNADPGYYVAGYYYNALPYGGWDAAAAGPVVSFGFEVVADLPAPPEGPNDGACR